MAALRELVLYQRWANLKLLDHVATLDASVLETAIEGTGASIKQIFGHMLEQERWGLGVLGAELGADPRTLRDGFSEHAEGWLWVIDRLDVLDRSALPPPGSGFETPIPAFATMYLLQTVHHQELHRTHVRSTLDVLGHSVPGTDPTDVWAYWADQHGAVLPGG